MPHPTCPYSFPLDSGTRCGVLLDLHGLHLVDAHVTDLAVVLDVECGDPRTSIPGAE